MFDVLSVNLLIKDNWCEIVECDFYFSLQQSDISTLKQEDDNCKNQLMNVENAQAKRLIIDEMSKTRAKRSTQLIIIVTNSLIDWLSKQKDQLLIVIFADSRCVKWNWNTFIAFKEKISSFSQIYDHSRWLTMRIMNNIYRLQRQNFVVYLSRRIWFNDFLLIRVFLRAIWRFYFVYSRISTNNLFRRKFDRVSINLAKFKARNRVESVKMISSSSLLIENCVEDVIVANWRFRAKDEIVTNWIVVFLSTRWRC